MSLVKISSLLIAATVLFGVSLSAEEEENIEPTAYHPAPPPPGASNAIQFRAQQQQFKPLPFRSCGKDGVYKDGRCEAHPSTDEGETEQKPAQDASD